MRESEPAGQFGRTGPCDLKVHSGYATQKSLDRHGAPEQLVVVQDEVTLSENPVNRGRLNPRRGECCGTSVMIMDEDWNWVRCPEPYCLTVSTGLSCPVESAHNTLRELLVAVCMHACTHAQI